VIIKDAPESLVRSAILWCPELAGDAPVPAYVAGGFIRAYFAGEMPSDMDLFCRSAGMADTTEERLVKSGWQKVFETDRARTYERANEKGRARSVQVIRFAYAEPAEMISRFDWTVCAAALELSLGGAGMLVIHDNFFEHLAGRVLHYNDSPRPLASLRRMVKYLRRGYHICDENLIRLAEAVSRDVDWDDPEAVQDAIAGLDPEGGRRIRVID